jgi:hypothetical protein
MKLIAINHIVFLADPRTRTYYGIDGTPIAFDSFAGLPQRGVNTSLEGPRCLYDWQADPGKYGPAYAVAWVIDRRDGHALFTAGGSLLYILAFGRENGFDIRIDRIMDDRNAARAAAHVEW